MKKQSKLFIATILFMSISSGTVHSYLSPARRLLSGGAGYRANPILIAKKVNDLPLVREEEDAASVSGIDSTEQEPVISWMAPGKTYGTFG